MANDGKTRVEKFDGQDFGWWKMQIEDLLCQKDLDQALTGTKPKKIGDAEWAALDRKALSVIRFTLAKNVAFNIVKETTTCGLMKALSNMYEKPSASNKVFLIRQLVNTRMREGMSVTSYINEFNTILSRLLSVDIKFEDEVQALLLLSSLPKSWSGTVTAISGSAGTSKLTFEGIRDFILGEDIRRRSSGESSSALLSTEGRGRRTERGKARGKSKSRKRSQSKPRKNIQCWKCKETGHFRNQCPNQTVGNREVNAATDDSEDALVCCIETSAESWILDSGASFHATYNMKMVKNLRTGKLGRVRLADHRTLDITGIGDVGVKTSLGTTWTLKDVRVILILKKMLISAVQLDDQGYWTTFGRGQWKVVKENLVIARGKKRGTLYMVEIPDDEVNAVTNELKPSRLWHQRLGHMSEKGMKMLVARGKLPDLKKVDSEFCESCVLGKKKKVSFVKEGQTPKAQKLELVHTDVYGPTPVSSLGGSNYYVTFIDDSTRKVWVYFLKNKFDVFNTFKKWSLDLTSNVIRHLRVTPVRICKSNKINPSLERLDPQRSSLHLDARDPQKPNSSLMYAMVCTRPDIAHAVGVVSRFMSDPGREHWEAVKWLLRYLKGTSKMGLYFKGKDLVLRGYTDADLGGCKKTFKSTTGYIFTVGGTVVSWMSRLQKSVALSTTEAEYMAVAEASKELVWLKTFLEELGKKQVDYSLYCDNESVVKLAKNPVYHGKTKHIGMRYHCVRGLINDGTMNLMNISGVKNPADMFTKSVVLDKLKFCMTSAGLQE
ncbi:hypothetical protein OSB04_011784 [Centaurea solstitialis]|uniref:CCHC-type domain-containing protein n=1 Tax=Centaurea solstitialis TaxID=347529 RepID=A0AA38TLU7_9ASTR|nr:hypothetical protein OSB04_011784 [Centaurea solstitialis]